MRATQLQSEALVQNIAAQTSQKSSGITWVTRICGP
jgi:hypothetical protein